MSVFLSPTQSVRRVLAEWDVAHSTVVVGVSGGVDSMCLMHLLAREAAARDLSPHIVHVHHGIRGADADADAAFVKERARALGLPVTVRRIDIPTLAREAKSSLEETARQWRYAILAEEAERLAARWVAVAHNADDQVETVLMHILRGTGLAGLRGMRPSTWYPLLRLPLVPPERRPKQEDLWLIRPLLYARRRDIVAWSEAEGISYRFDLSNLDTTYFRNRLRHEILPQLEQVNPQVRQALFITAELAAADFDLVHPLARTAWAAIFREEGGNGPAPHHSPPTWVRFDLAGWRALPLALRRAILRDAIMYLNREVRDVGFAQVEAARAFLENRDMPAGSEWHFTAGLVVRREYTTFLVGEQDAPAWHGPQVEEDIAIPTTGTFALGRGWRAEVEVFPRERVGDAWRRNPDPYTAYFDADAVAWPLHMRPRREGDRIEPLGMPGKHPLVSEVMINRKVPRWARVRWPLLVDANDRVLWIVGVRQAEAGKITPDTQRVLILRITRHENPSR